MNWMKPEHKPGEERNRGTPGKPFSQHPHQRRCREMENYIAEVPANRILRKERVIDKQPCRKNWPVIVDRRVGEKMAPNVRYEELRKVMPRCEARIYNDLRIVIVNEPKAKRVCISCKCKQGNQPSSILLHDGNQLRPVVDGFWKSLEELQNGVNEDRFREVTVERKQRNSAALG